MYPLAFFFPSSLFWLLTRYLAFESFGIDVSIAGRKKKSAGTLPRNSILYISSRRVLILVFTAPTDKDSITLRLSICLCLLVGFFSSTCSLNMKISYKFWKTQFSVVYILWYYYNWILKNFTFLFFVISVWYWILYSDNPFYKLANFFD